MTNVSETWFCSLRVLYRVFSFIQAFLEHWTEPLHSNRSLQVVGGIYQASPDLSMSLPQNLSPQETQVANGFCSSLCAGLFPSTEDPATPTRSRDWRSPPATPSESRQRAKQGRDLSQKLIPSAQPKVSLPPSKVRGSRLRTVVRGKMHWHHTCQVQVWPQCILNISNNKMKSEFLKKKKKLCGRLSGVNAYMYRLLYSICMFIANNIVV